MVAKKNNRIKQTRNAKRATNKQAIYIAQPMTFRYTPTNPGQVSLKGVIAVDSTTSGLYLSYSGFAIWSPQALAILTPFEFWRVKGFSVQALIAGGNISPYNVAFNLTNSPATPDSSVVSILDDDYAAIANASVQPILRPPNAYWDQGSRVWYRAIAGTTSEHIAGSIAINGTGGATAATVVGWMMIEMLLEFHTLV